MIEGLNGIQEKFVIDIYNAMLSSVDEDEDDWDEEEEKD